MSPQQSNDSPANDKAVGIKEAEDFLSSTSDLTEEEANEEVIPETLGELKLIDDDEEDEEDDDVKKKKDSEKTKEGEENKEPELELDDELVTPPARQEILKAYPDLFKKFPFIDRALRQEKEYTELFGTVEDARDAQQRSAEYSQFENDLLQGNTNGLFKSLKNADETAFAEAVDNLLPTLAQVDQAAYNHIIGDVIKRTLISAVNASTNLDEDSAQQLKLAAGIIHQFAFGPGKFRPPTRFNRNYQDQNNPERQQLNNERAQFFNEQFGSITNDLQGKVDNLLKNTISANIDPKGAMNSYVKKTAVRDSLDLLTRLIAQDERFQQHKDNLWKKALESNFDRRLVDSIRSSYLSRAKALLPSVLKKVRAEALNNRSSDNGDERTERRFKDTRPDKERAPAQSRGKGEKSKVPRGMTTLDYLNSD